MVKTTDDRVLKIHGETLSKLLGLPDTTYFELNELRAIKAAEVGSEMRFRGKLVKITMSAKAISALIADKIQKK